MTGETGGLELASTIILVLQANRLTKCAKKTIDTAEDRATEARHFKLMGMCGFF